MEKVSVHYANFDFDLKLSNASYQRHVEPESIVNKKLRYLFFWVCNKNEALLTYDSDYVKKYDAQILEIRNILPIGSDTVEQGLNYWWGDISNEDLWRKEKEINSKFLSHHAEKELGIYCTGEIKEFEPSDLENTNILKKEHGFTGKGVVKSLNFKGKVLCEKLLNKQEDFGTIINKKGAIFFRNFVDKSGQYLASHFNSSYGHQHPETLKVHRRVYNYYKKRFSINFLQIDSFTYLNNGKHCWRYLCEVNHRKSIGQIAYCIHKELGGPESLFMLLPNSYKIDVKTNYDKKAKTGIIKLSHIDEEIQCYLITGDSRITLRNYLERSKLSLAVPMIKL